MDPGIDCAPTASAMKREHVAVVMVDLVESVALMQTDFEDVVLRWQAPVSRRAAHCG